MPSSIAPSKPARSDAVRTRKALIAAASDAFAEQGIEASIAEIAERAGIAKGTVFRHFPTKEDLLAAIMGENMAVLLAAGERLSDSDDPAGALYEFMSVAIELQAKDRAFCQVAQGQAADHPDVRRGQESLRQIADLLTDRARDSKSIRPDITGGDIMLLMSGIFQTAYPALTTEPLLWRRYLRLLFDGMQAMGADPLPR